MAPGAQRQRRNIFRKPFLQRDRRVKFVDIAIFHFRTFITTITGSFARFFLDSIVVSIPACHAGDPGSIPGRGDCEERDLTHTLFPYSLGG